MVIQSNEQRDIERMTSDWCGGDSIAKKELYLFVDNGCMQGMYGFIFYFDWDGERAISKQFQIEWYISCKEMVNTLVWKLKRHRMINNAQIYNLFENALEK